MNEPVNRLDDDKSPATVLSEIPRHPSDREPYAAAGAPVAVPRLNAILFLLTLLTTTMAGAYLAGAELSLMSPLASLGALAEGLSFSIPLMAILLAHELGHYFTSRRHGVDASLPYFIPVPPPFSTIFIFGTLGAFIRMRNIPPSRRVMFDIGAAGPWAGMLIALPATIIGLQHSTIGPLDSSTGGLDLGNSLLFLGLSRWVLGVDPNSVNITLHPIALAGWLGFFVTMLNLLPSGQLDGGHVSYALFGRRHRLISRCAVLGCVAMAVVPFILGRDAWWGWLMWALLLILIGLGHPVTADQETPLDGRRQVAAWLTVALFAVTFAPVPFSYSPPGVPQDKDKIYQVMHHEAAPPAAHSSVPHGLRI